MAVPYGNPPRVSPTVLFDDSRGRCKQALPKPSEPPYRPRMGFDWKKLESDEADRHNRLAWTMGLAWVVIGLVGPAIGFLVTGTYDWVNALLWLALGLVVFVPAAVARRRRSKGRNKHSSRPV